MLACSNLTCGLFLIGADELCAGCAKLTESAFKAAAPETPETLDMTILPLLDSIRRKGRRLGAGGLFPEIRVSSGLNGALTIAIGMEVSRKASLEPSLLGPFTIVRGPDIAGQLLHILDLLETPGIAVYPMYLGPQPPPSPRPPPAAPPPRPAETFPAVPGWAGSEDFGGSDF
jgi:hypothetical protein